MHSYDDIIKAKSLYFLGKNIVRKNLSNNINIKKIINKKNIELAYDLQAGNYIKRVIKKKKWAKSFALEASNIINHYTKKNSTLMDAGSGELTSLIDILNCLEGKFSKSFAFDISLSRLILGINYMKKELKSIKKPAIFCAELSSIPLPQNSVDTSMTVHSLEPNSQDSSNIIKELLRVSRDNLILFEPCYEKSSVKAKKRMNKHNYVKGLENLIKKHKGKIKDIIEIKNSESEFNKTFCFIVDLKHLKNGKKKNKIKFTFPGKSTHLKYFNNFYFSKETGYIFPEISKIPILKLDTAILGSKVVKS